MKWLRLIYRPHGQGLPLTYALILLFALLMTVTVTVSSYLSFKNGLRAATEIAKGWVKAVAQRAEDNIDNLLGQARRINENNLLELRGGSLRHNDLHRLGNTFLNQLQSHPQVTIIGFGREDGDYIAYDRRFGAISRALRDASTKDLLELRFLDSSGKLGPLVGGIRNRIAFNAPERLWYQTGTSATTHVWCPVYTYPSTNQHAIDTVLPFRNAEGKVLGVLICSLSLDHISRFLTNLARSSKSHLFIFDQEGLLIGSSNPGEVAGQQTSSGPPTRIHVTTSSNLLTRYAALEFIDSKWSHQHAAEYSGSFVGTDGKKYLIHAFPIAKKAGLNWTLMAVTPESIISAPLRREIYRTLFTSATAWIMSCVLGIFLLKRLTRQVTAANTIMDEFLSNIHHELRTPVSGIISNAERLSKHIQEERSFDAMGKAHLDNILRAGRRLKANVTKVLSFSKISAGKLELVQEIFSLDECIEDVKANTLAQAADKNHALRIHVTQETPRWLVGDRGGLCDVLTNLLGNAIKFTEANGEMSLSVECDGPAAKKEARLKFVVMDTGPGIPHGQEEAIFMRFFKANQRHEGTGLGLPIAKKLTDMMGGTIDGRNRPHPEKGACFTVVIPFELPDSPPVEARNPNQERMNEDGFRLTGLRVLVVDDEKDIRMPIVEAFREWDCRVAEAASCREVYVAVMQEEFDLILLDLRLGDGQGYDAARFIRQNPQSLNTKTIIMAWTAYDKARVERECKVAGINEVIENKGGSNDIKTVLLDKFPGLCAASRRGAPKETPPTARDPKPEHPAPRGLTARRKLLWEWPERSARTRQAIDAQNFKSLSEEAHKMVGIFKGNDCIELERLARRMENAATIREMPEALENFEKIEKALTEARNQETFTPLHSHHGNSHS